MRKTHHNNFPLPEDAILKAAFAAGKDLGLNWKILKQKTQVGERRAEVWIHLRAGGHDVKYRTMVKLGLRPAMLGVVNQHKQALGKNALLVADYITPPLADALRNHGIEFIDAAGNAYLAKPPLFVWVKGQRPIEKLFGRQSKGRVFQPSGMRVVFSLLCQPDLADRSYRDLALRADVSHGTVGWVMQELTALGHLATVKGRRRLLNAEALLRQWVEAYLRTLRPRLMLGRYHADPLGWTADYEAEKYHLLLSGEPAAARLTGALRPGTATFYGEKIEPRLLLDQRLRADPHGNVEIIQNFWNFDAETPGLVPLILIYADLLAIGDARCLEVARELYGRIIDRFI